MSYCLLVLANGRRTSPFRVGIGGYASRRGRFLRSRAPNQQSARAADMNASHGMKRLLANPRCFCMRHDSDTQPCTSSHDKAQPADPSRTIRSKYELINVVLSNSVWHTDSLQNPLAPSFSPSNYEPPRALLLSAEELTLKRQCLEERCFLPWAIIGRLRHGRASRRTSARTSPPTIGVSNPSG